MIYSSANELKVSQEKYYRIFERQEEIMKKMREDLEEKSNMFLSEIFQRNFGAQIFPYDQSF